MPQLVMQTYIYVCKDEKEADEFIGFLRTLKEYDVNREMADRYKYKKYFWRGQWKVKVKKTPYHIKV